MPLRPVSFREAKRRLEALGFSETTQRGSHVKFVRRAGDATLTAVVPKHNEVAVGTLRSMLRQAQVSVEQWVSLD